MKKQGTRLPDGRRKFPGKRLLASFVSLCMIVSLLPITALAEEGRLYLPSAVTAENLEEISALLPRYIQAGEEKIALTWTYDEAAGIFTAVLPDGYALAEGARILTVETVVMGAGTLEETTEETDYKALDGSDVSVTAAIVTSELTAWNDTGTTTGWYVVEGEMTITTQWRSREL